MDPYSQMLERVQREGFAQHMTVEYARDAIQHPDFDIPDVIATSPTGRVLLIVEGDKADVGPIIEKALQQLEAMKS